MNEIKKVVGINLIVMLVYSLLLRMPSFYQHRDKSWAILGGMAWMIILQLVINLILAIICSNIKKGKLAKAFAISMGVVLVIGFSTCWASSSF